MTTKLNPAILPYLYQEELYRIEKPGNPEHSPEPADSLVAKRVLVVLDSLEEERELLEKILASVSIGMKDVDLIHESEEVELSQYKKVLLFCTKPWKDLNYEPYKEAGHNDLRYLYSSPLVELRADVELKKKLWAALKGFSC